jgi:putative nucleotidyltransferase with HDIG domain
VEKILVVDDEADIVDLVAEFLGSIGYDVCGLTEPREGLAAVQTFQPDVCVLDFRMPGVTGGDLCRQFKTIDSTIEVIFLTGEDDTELAIEMMKLGAIDYLLKPVGLLKLRSSLLRALEHRRLVQDNIAYQERLELLVAEKTKALQEALERLGLIHGATLEALGSALDFRDQSTSGHSRRVASLTTGIAKEIGISGETLLQVEQGAFLHDIGKLRIPDGILLKPSSLTPEEWNTMRCHAKYGREFLERIDFLRGAADLVYTHHEKFDGSGYPQGLKAEAIPVGSRCFAIVDAVDAMIYKRPYNRPISFSQAADEVHRCAGSHFDPELVDVALQYLSGHLGLAQSASDRLNG